MMGKKELVVWLVCLAAVIAVAIMALPAVQSEPSSQVVVKGKPLAGEQPLITRTEGDVQLTKDEALDLMNLRFTLIAAEADYKQAVAEWMMALRLYSAKYGVAYEVIGGQVVLVSHDLDLAKGVFKSKQKEPK